MPHEPAFETTALRLPVRADVEELLGVHMVAEIHGGFQSRVFRAEPRDTSVGELAVKFTDARDVDALEFSSKLDVVVQLAGRDDHIVAPVELAGSLVNRVGDWLVVGYPLISGRTPDTADRADVERMGRALARLHQSLALVTVELPRVAALRVVPDAPAATSRYQLIHGDYSASNLVLDPNNRLWIFDFDDCGLGSVEFEIGNTLFMTRFAAMLANEDLRGGFADFRRWFVGSYNAAATHAVGESAIEDALRTRRWALLYWLDHLAVAPIGIRNSSPAWRERLRVLAGAPD